MILIPVSIGELIDINTILKLKKKYCKNNSQIQNILHEIEMLKEKIESINMPNFDIVYNKLYNVNHKLWTIEDDIRKLEGKQQYNDDYIICAHCVIFFNDMRSKIKKEINTKYNSEICEEKIYDHYNIEIKNKSLYKKLHLYLEKLNNL